MIHTSTQRTLPWIHNTCTCTYIISEQPQYVCRVMGIDRRISIVCNVHVHVYIRYISWCHTLSVKEKLSADRDSEISATSLRVSLLCPVSHNLLGT